MYLGYANTTLSNAHHKWKLDILLLCMHWFVFFCLWWLFFKADGVYSICYSVLLEEDMTIQALIARCYSLSLSLSFIQKLYEDAITNNLKIHNSSLNSNFHIPSTAAVFQFNPINVEAQVDFWLSHRMVLFYALFHSVYSYCKCRRITSIYFK